MIGKIVKWEVMEKEMEIGRNSNFLYIPLHRLRHISVIQPKRIYISCYDFSKSHMEDKQAIIQDIITFLKAVEATS